MDITESNKYLEFLNFALHGAPSSGAELVVVLGFGTLSDFFTINSPGLGYEVNDILDVGAVEETEGSYRGTIIVTQVGDDGEVLEAAINDYGFGYVDSDFNSQTAYSTEYPNEGAGLGVGCTVNFTVARIVDRIDVISPGHGYFTEDTTPFYPFGAAELEFIPAEGEIPGVYPPNYTMDLKPDGGIQSITISNQQQGSYSIPPLVRVNTYRADNSVTLMINLVDFDFRKYHERCYDALTAYMQCNVAPPETVPILYELLIKAKNSFGQYYGWGEG